MASHGASREGFTASLPRFLGECEPLTRAYSWAFECASAAGGAIFVNNDERVRNV